jgi:hypothetical protein
MHKSALLALPSTVIALSAVASLSGACASKPPLDSVNMNLGASLVPVKDCDEAERVIRQVALVDMNRRIDELVQRTFDERVECGGVDEAMASAGSGSSSGGAPPPSNAGGAKQASGTNNQVAGVDEADFIKNDNKFIYAGINGALRIIEAFPGDRAREVGRVALQGEVRKLFVEGDRVLVYSSIAAQSGGGAGSPSSGVRPNYGARNECTYGYECVPSADGTATRVTVFDVSNKALPVKVRELTYSGSLIAARKIGSAVHTVVSQGQPIFDGVSYSIEASCAESSMDRARMRAEYEFLRAKNANIINSAPVRTTFPAVTDSANAGDLAASCRGFYRSSLGDGAGFTSVVSLDMSSSEAPNLATVISRPGHVYASAEALYFATPHTQGGYGWYEGYGDTKLVSDIHKFRIGVSPSLTAYQASGLMAGGVLNQFAMDEHNGFFRVAASTGRTPDPKVSSTVAVFQQRGAALAVVGKVENIAPTEDIRSVRFDGDRGYLVTFKKTDPLFVVGLENPSAPAVLGELKIPGFSTYMHMMDKTHLLTIGYDSEDHGSFAYFTGVLLQIFDVSNPAAPTLTHKERIGTRGSSSEALTNHLAFNYFKPMDLLALPMTVCEGGGTNGSYGQSLTFSGLMVYGVTAQGGFQNRGRIAHPNAANGSGYDAALCSNWWTDASSTVKRSVIMDNFIYSVASDTIRIADLNNLSATVATVSLK